LEQQIQAPEHLVAVPGFWQAAFVLKNHQRCAEEPGKRLKPVEKAEVVIAAYFDQRL
jgi:hypothetical protein